MSSVTFPTRPAGLHPPGAPKRASHCHCVGGPLFDPDSGRCIRCGRDTKDEIAEVWSDRRRRMAANRERRARRAA